MSQQDLLRARQLIQAKRFDEARLLLMEIDHPTAERWLDKIDEISPAVKYKYVDTAPVDRKMPNFIGLIFILLICLFAFALQTGNSSLSLIIILLGLFIRFLIVK